MSSPAYDRPPRAAIAALPEAAPAVWRARYCPLLRCAPHPIDPARVDLGYAA